MEILLVAALPLFSWSSEELCVAASGNIFFQNIKMHFLLRQPVKGWEKQDSYLFVCWSNTTAYLFAEFL